jgi:hypothetical protein
VLVVLSLSKELISLLWAEVTVAFDALIVKDATWAANAAEGYREPENDNCDDGKSCSSSLGLSICLCDCVCIRTIVVFIAFVALAFTTATASATATIRAGIVSSNVKLRISISSCFLGIL